MRYLLFLISIFFISCSNDDEDIDISRDKYFKIVSFKTNGTQLDLNNDNLSNSNILLELTNYSAYPYDLEIKRLSDNSELFSFYLPKQNIINNFVEFYRGGGFTFLQEEEDIVNNIEIDDENFITELVKSSASNYKLTLQKKYYDFSTKTMETIEFEIIFEQIE